MYILFIWLGSDASESCKTARFYQRRIGFVERVEVFQLLSKPIILIVPIVDESLAGVNARATHMYGATCAREVGKVGWEEAVQREN